MSFFFNDSAPTRGRDDSQATLGGLSLDTLRKHQCKVCPRAKDTSLENPKLVAYGSRKPDIYILGEAPKGYEDEKGEICSQQYYSRLTSLLPRELSLRFYSIIRCATPPNRGPLAQEIECCRPFIERDIARADPRVILCLGGDALSWLLRKGVQMSAWRGRFLAVKIEGKEYFVYALHHPEYIDSLLDGNSSKGQDEYHIWKLDIKRFLDRFQARRMPDCRVIDDPKEHNAGIQVITGYRGDDDLHEIYLALKRISDYPDIGIDIETKGLRPYSAQNYMGTVSVGTFEDTLAFPLHLKGTWPTPQHAREAVSMFGEFMIHSGRKVAHNLEFEQEWLAYEYGMPAVRMTEWHDTMALAYALDQRPGVMLKLDVLGRLYFGFWIKSLAVINLKNIERNDPVDLLWYNGRDTKWEHALYQTLLQEIDLIDDEGHQLLVEADRIVRTAPTLVGAQLRGVKPSMSAVRRITAEFNEKISGIERQLLEFDSVQEYTRRFGQFSASSHDHCNALFRDVLRRSEGKTSGGKGYSTSEAVLKQIPLPESSLILELRSLLTIKSNFLDKVPDLVWDDGKFHTNYNSKLVGTGRLSSDNPNLQNFPKRKMKHVRNMVKAPKRYKLVAADYGQIEARMIAFLSQDKNFIAALFDGFDIHAHWTERFNDESRGQFFSNISKEYNVELSDDKQLFYEGRSAIKNRWVFPLFFGASHKSCSRNLQLPLDLCEELKEEFWDFFPGVRSWQQRVLELYDTKGYVVCALGRRRWGPLSYNERINTPVQGSSSDVVVLAMDRCAEQSYVRDEPDIHPIMNIHDDLTFLLPAIGLDDSIREVAQLMTVPDGSMGINIPLVTEFQVGDSWGDLHDYAEFSSLKDFNDPALNWYYDEKSTAETRSTRRRR